MLQAYDAAARHTPLPVCPDSKSLAILPGRCRLEKKISDLDTKLVAFKQQIASARTPAAKNAAKAQALRLLKQKKAYQGQLDQLGAQQLNLDSASFMAQQMQARS